MNLQKYIVRRTEEDGLSQKEWSFRLRDHPSDIVLQLESFQVKERKTKRHKFVIQDGSWFRLNWEAREMREVLLLKEEPELPQDVLDEALRLVTSSIRFERSV